MAITKSTKVRDSRYVQGGTTEIFPKRLGWWDRKVLQKSNADVTITISPKYNLRPDLLAFDMYGNVNLAWVVLQFNNIVDVNEEFITGKVITLPTKKRLVTEILNASPNFR